MTPDLWWERRAACALAMLRETYTHGLGRLDHAEPRLAAALGDVLARPGSLVRAVVAYLIGVEMGLAEEAARSLACGMEYLHTASLVFDDLPAMDDARMRRGAACLHVTHGEAIAMLAALALINRGYSMLWQGISTADARRRKLGGEWVEARLGPFGVTGGQALDLRGWRDGQSAAEVSEVAARKTGELLRLTLVLPAIIGNGTEREIKLLDRLALLRGLAYQAADDLKDVLAVQDSHGKTGGRDDELGRPNMVAAEGLAATIGRFHRLQAMGDRVAAALPGTADRWGMLKALKVPVPAPAIATGDLLEATAG
ncbi:MAG: polyprenyl synthetase family protein [Verrucomicrobia bacterium]|nr:polyprenyl synthetase family protein [Verrucomicrobiota bacterium]